MIEVPEAPRPLQPQERAVFQRAARTRSQLAAMRSDLKDVVAYLASCRLRINATVSRRRPALEMIATFVLMTGLATLAPFAAEGVKRGLQALAN